MLRKGGLKLEKHGGAHGTGHEPAYFQQDSGISSFLDDENIQFIDSKEEDELAKFQDGGQGVVSGLEDGSLASMKNNKTHEGTYDSPSNLSDLETPLNDHVDGWLKTNASSAVCSINMTAGVAALSSSSGQAAGTESTRNISLSLGTTGIQDLVSSNNIIPNESSLQQTSSSSFILNSSDGISSIVSVKPDMTKSLTPGSSQSTLSLAGSNDSAISINSLLEHGSQGIQEFSFGNLSEDRSNTLMTPQELEAMPERGLEFEESVGPRDAKLSLPNGDLAAEGHSQVEPVQTQTESSENGTSTNPLSLASISISTDKSSNTTHIVLQTPQGLQVYQLNTADLTQATSALEQLGAHATTQGPGAGTIAVANLKDGMVAIPLDGASFNTNGITLDSSLIRDNVSDSDTSTSQMAAGKCKCPYEGCDKVFKKPVKLKIHMMKHTGERPFKCQENGCEWAFTTAYKLKRHMESHLGQKNYVCDIEGCGKKFSTIYNLRTHIDLHKRPNSHVCPEMGCEACFDTRRKLDAHLMKSHKDQGKKYKCPYEGCNKTFFSLSCMGSHKRVHLQDRDLTCHFEGCGRVFDKLCRLKQHERMHTGEKPYVCPVDGCGWAFTSSSKLTRHQQKHTQDRKWKCPDPNCNKAFLRAEHLKQHVLSHSGDRPFRCPVEGCSATFRAKCSLRVHVKKHNQPQKKVIFYCPLEGCDKKYITKISLRNHIAKHYTHDVTDGSGFDIVPILAEELQDNSLDGYSQSQVVTSSGVTIHPNSVILTSPDGTLLNPADFIATGDQSIVTAVQFPNDVITHHVGNNVVTQLIVTDSHTSSTDSLITTTAATSSSPTAKIAIATDSSAEGATRLLQENYSGSARTDYMSNHILSDRAKRRRQLLREKASIGFDELHLQDLAPKSTDLVPPSSGPTIAPHEILTSHAITFKDPETGTTYVQTQLLQDDPPNPEIYPPGEAHSPLSGDLSDGVLQDASTSDHTQPCVIFTSSTINLQDLE
ncbi:zinc finger protein ZXDC [Lingula anatina]|uniref:Zinc finger protein ZXDC n=1 Tax=Lingula anatina TaxID=7574 RepID=A0A1S3IEN4_LINAN|nr:zinc finger protein ZXDC [Lingula anatina]|eukprot:XP_013396692.1 zinc finger protein ZXDC [Lingula anatina]